MFSVLVCIIAFITYSDGAIFRSNIILGRSDPTRTQHASPVSVVDYALHDAPPERAVSYSISDEDYAYLKRHKVEGQDSPYNPDPQEHEPTFERYASYDHGHSYVTNSDVLQKRDAGTNSINGYNPPRNVPSVHKHVHYLAPPPGFVDRPHSVSRVIQPKSRYNIVFIKTALQEPSYHLQHVYQNRQAFDDDKKLMYVQPKKREYPQLLPLPSKSPSLPDAFFVKSKQHSSHNPEVYPHSVPYLYKNISRVPEMQYL